jgi:hypothetical protein
VANTLTSPTRRGLLSSPPTGATGSQGDRIAGLPDGLFSNQNPNFGYILEGLEMEIVGIHILWPVGLFTAIWYILGLLGIFFPNLACCTKKHLAKLPDWVANFHLLGHLLTLGVRFENCKIANIFW